MVTPLDALAIINYLNLHHGSSILPPDVFRYRRLFGRQRRRCRFGTRRFGNHQLHQRADLRGRCQTRRLSAAVSSSRAGALSTDMRLPDLTGPLSPAAQAPTADSASAAVTWAISAVVSNHPTATSLVGASPAAFGPQTAIQIGSPANGTSATGSWGLNQAAVDSYFAGGVRRNTNSSVQAGAADIVLAKLRGLAHSHGCRNTHSWASRWLKPATTIGRRAAVAARPKIPRARPAAPCIRPSAMARATRPRNTARQPTKLSSRPR